MNDKPERIRIKRLGEGDISTFKKLIQLFREVFKDKQGLPTNDAYLQKLLVKPGFIAYVLIYENQLAGGLTAYELPMYNTEHAEIFVYDVAILPRFQRKGLGTELLASLREYAGKNGIAEIFATAHEEDKHAIDFYKSTGGKAEKVVHFSYNLDSIKI